MPNAIPIINSEKNSGLIKSNLPIEIINNDNNIIPTININEPKLSVQEYNISIISNNNSNQPVPFIDEHENLIIEMGSQGPCGPAGSPGPIGPQGPSGPPGLTGNGIDRIEKTSTSGITDIYTIYFTNGDTFEYQITNGVVYYYDGPYDVTPMVNTTQILPTTNLVMSSDVNIHEIPYSEVSNLSGGKTATIGQL